MLCLKLEPKSLNYYIGWTSQCNQRGDRILLFYTININCIWLAAFIETWIVPINSLFKQIFRWKNIYLCNVVPRWQTFLFTGPSRMAKCAKLRIVEIISMNICAKHSLEDSSDMMTVKQSFIERETHFCKLQLTARLQLFTLDNI
jgi:hypothetical protein